MSLAVADLRANKLYRWKHDHACVVEYRGKYQGWHQFVLPDRPEEGVWCEVLDEDLRLLEEFDE